MQAHVPFSASESENPEDLRELAGEDVPLALFRRTLLCRLPQDPIQEVAGTEAPGVLLEVYLLRSSSSLKAVEYRGDADPASVNG